MCLALLAFLQIWKDEVRFGKLLLNPIMLFKTEVLSSLTVSVYSIWDIPPFTVQLFQLSVAKFKRGFAARC